MIEMLQLQNIKVEMQHHLLFEQINTNVQQGDVIGVIGKNGAGKSTLLHLLNGDIEPDGGSIKHLQENLVFTMVEQETESYSFDEVTPQEEAILGKWNVPTREFSKLSGGERLKARLAKGLAKDADILMLDEPTNHLDEKSAKVLITQVSEHQGAVILVSHDRYFLDKVATKIWAIEDQKLITHMGNYSSYMEEREKIRLIQQREYEKQQKMKERIEGQMNQLTSWSKSAHAQSTKQEFPKEYYRSKAKRMDAQVKSKQKRLEKELERINAEAPKAEYEVHFQLKTSHKAGKRFLEVKDVEKTFYGHTLFQSANFTILHGEKVAITGENGSGKTTFINMVMGNEPVSKGEIWVSPSANIGYLTQEVFDLPLDKTPQQLFYQETFAERGKVRNLMKHLGFLETQWSEPINQMSMGERVKCKLMKYIMDEKEVLILDEPTNHLDLPSREQLEETLEHFTGTLLVVSHDRYFLEKTTNSKLVFSNQTIVKEFNELEPSKVDDREQKRMALETERQEVLGKLSFMTPTHKEYRELDKRFIELTERIKALQ
jgi:macrolide transport system ATP-binding/permease protein